MSWVYNSSSHEWQYVRDGEVLYRVTVEEWSNFLTMYGGGSITVDGFTIPVPVAKYFITKEELDRDEALRKILSALAVKE